MGCTSCGNKPGCDHRKTGMFEAIDEALQRLYPTRRWGDRDDGAVADGGAAATAAELADRLAHRLGVMALCQPGGPEEYCDYVYLLCFGRQPSILEVRTGAVSAAEAWGAAEEGSEEDSNVEELYLRVALSSVAPFAAVQQVAMRMFRAGDQVVVSEEPRTGVFDPILLARFQKLVAVLAEFGIRNLDFGDLTQAPQDFDDQPYVARYGGPPMVANYLFYPQPCSSVVTTVHASR